MPIYTKVLPQITEPIKTTTLKELVAVLPEHLAYPMDVWIAGKIASYGRTTGNLLFLTHGEFPSVEVRMYFEGLVKPLGINAAISIQWKDRSVPALRLYNKGRLIVDKGLHYTELPEPIEETPVLTIDEVTAKLPKNIEWKHTMYLTGGLVRNGWSANDLDIIIFEKTDPKTRYAIRTFFTNLLGWRTDVGIFVMAEREPVYLFKLYEKGICLL